MGLPLLCRKSSSLPMPGDLLLSTLHAIQALAGPKTCHQHQRHQHHQRRQHQHHQDHHHHLAIVLQPGNSAGQQDIHPAAQAHACVMALLLTSSASQQPASTSARSCFIRILSHFESMLNKVLAEKEKKKKKKKKKKKVLCVDTPC